MASSNKNNESLSTDDKFVNEETIIPVVKEQLTISTRKVTTGEIIVDTKVNSEIVSVPLTTIKTTYREVRVPANRVVDTMPQTRMEGDNIIIPVVREEEVIVKRLILVEEIHLVKTTAVEERTEEVEIRTETATVSRTNPNQEFIATP